MKDQAEQLAAMTATAAYLGVSDTLGAEPGLEEAKKTPGRLRVRAGGLFLES